MGCFGGGTRGRSGMVFFSGKARDRTATSPSSVSKSKSSVERRASTVDLVYGTMARWIMLVAIVDALFRGYRE